MIQRCSSTMLPLLMLLTTLIVGSDSATEILGKTVTLTSVQSSVEFDRIEWDPKQQLTVAARFATHSINGQLMLIKGIVQDTDETAFELSVVLKQQDLSVYLRDQFDAVIGEGESIKKDIATGEENSLVIELNLVQNGLGITFGQGSQARIPITEKIPSDKNIDIIIYLGSTSGDSNDSIVGCVTLVSVFLGAPVIFEVRTLSDDIVEGCKNPCDGYNCNGGLCVNEFSKPVCDCFETNNHGAQCQTESLPVTVASEHYIRYELDKNEYQPHRIAFAFKVGRGVEEGLLLLASVGSKKKTYNGTLTLELIHVNNNANSINFRITDLITQNFSDFPEGESDPPFHDVEIRFNYHLNEVQVSIDEETKVAPWEMKDPTDQLILSDVIYFGGSPDESANGIGFAGCLKEPYVGLVAAITYLDIGGKKVTSNGKLGTCDDAAAPGAFRDSPVATEGPAEPDDTVEENAEPTSDKEDAEEENGGDDEDDGDGDNEPSDNEPDKTPEGDDDDANIPKVSVIATDGDEEDEEDGDKEDEEPERKQPVNAGFGIFDLLDASEENTPTQSKTVSCEQDEAMPCQNGGSCMKTKEGVRSCACITGYIGIFCQFSNFPSSCQEAYDLGEKEPGVYQIDVDGNGPLRSTFIRCENGVSTVRHNMPGATEGRSFKASDQILPLIYELFSPEQLRLLVRQSSNCSQSVRYDCNHAPLGFKEKKTWFYAAAQPTTFFARIGQTDNACPCYDDRSCQYGKNCNCDAKQYSNVDEGELHGFQAGITQIYVLQELGDDSGKFTVGPLQCHGDATSTNAITMRQREVTLKTEKWLGKSISFWFRTSQPSALLASITSKGRYFRIYLTDGHLLEYRFNLNEGNFEDASSFDRVVTLLSQSRLNDSSWHRVLVQVNSNELRLSLDKQNIFYQLMGTEKLDTKTFEYPLIIGGDATQEDGLIGCIKQLKIDDEPFDLLAAVRRATDKTYLSEGCQNFCKPENNPCQNAAECIDDYEARSYYCVCANPWVFSGKNCEHDVNTDSEVSFNDLEKGFLKYQDMEKNPITNTMMFSFRTDQSDAILAYAHDERYNFVQVHLSDENKISLTLNNNRTVERCTIVAEAGQEFSDMQWNQVLVVFGEKHTSLYVDHLLCMINDAHILSDSYITGFESGQDLLTVDPPMQPVAPSQLVPYTMLYVGGLPRSKGRGFRRLKRQASSRAFYGTIYPQILGCMRGFRIGDAIVDLRYGGVRPEDKYAVRVGCNTQCESMACQNSGHCTVAWQNLDPDAFALSSCDCSKTSYFGGSCTEDYGLTFEGQAAFVFDMIPVLKQFILTPKRKGDSFNFAFAAAQNGIKKHSRYLAVLQFASEIRLEIILNKNGSVNVGLLLPPLATQVYTFRGDFSDGYRHFIQTTLRDTSVTITVDSASFTFNPQGFQVTLASAQKIYLGGFEPTNKTDVPKNYEGCMSNADINFHLGDLFRFAPIRYYRDTGSKFSAFATTIPAEETLAQGPCASFKIPGALPPPQRNVQMPIWQSPFQPQKYERPATPPPSSDSGSGFPWWIIIVIVIIVLILVFVIVLFCCIRNRTKEEEGKPTAGGIGMPPRDPSGPSDNDDDYQKPVPSNRPNLYGDQHSNVDEMQPLKSAFPADPHVHHHHHPQGLPQQHQQPKPPQIFGSNQVKANLDLPAANTTLDQNKRTKELFLNSPPPPAASWGSVLSSDTYYTAREFGSQEDLPPPPSDDELYLQPYHTENVTPFERTSPARLSTFGDRTVPPDSPLHRPPTAPRQAKYVPVPTSPKLL